MPNPPFQPLTLSVEEITELRAELPKARQSYDEPNPEKRDWLPIFRVLMDCEFLIRSHEELRSQAQEAASLRQRLEEYKVAHDNAVNAWDSLKAQLEQAQQERDEAQAALVKLTADIPKAEKRLEQTAAKHARRASQAEAEEMQKQLDEWRVTATRQMVWIDGLKTQNEVLFDWLQKSMAGELRECSLDEALAELQRRRSPTGQEQG